MTFRNVNYSLQGHVTSTSQSPQPLAALLVNIILSLMIQKSGVYLSQKDHPMGEEYYGHVISGAQ